MRLNSKSRARGNQGIPDFLLRNPRGKWVVERNEGRRKNVECGVKDNPFSLFHPRHSQSPTPSGCRTLRPPGTERALWVVNRRQQRNQSFLKIHLCYLRCFLLSSLVPFVTAAPLRFAWPRAARP